MPYMTTAWNFDISGGSVPSILHQVTVPIIENTKCQEMFTKSGHKKIVRESFLCAGYDEGKKDSCEVSFGSELVASGGQMGVGGGKQDRNLTLSNQTVAGVQNDSYR